MKIMNANPQFTFKTQKFTRYNSPNKFLTKNKEKSAQNSPQKSYFHNINLTNISIKNKLFDRFQIQQQSIISQDQQDINKSFYINTKPSQTNFIYSSHKNSKANLNTNNKFSSPSVKTSNIATLQPIPLRTTLKKIQKLGFDSKRQYQHLSTCKSDKSNDSFTFKQRTYTQSFNNMSILDLQVQNSFLKQQNIKLNKQLNELKNSISYQNINRYQKMIDNLIKIQQINSEQIINLKSKLQIQNNRCDTLTRLNNTKDQQIILLTQRINQIQNILRESKEAFQTQLQSLEDKLTIVLKSYQYLEIDCRNAEKQWQDFKQKWKQEKSTYLHRISFLEEYVSTIS